MGYPLRTDTVRDYQRRLTVIAIVHSKSKYQTCLKMLRDCSPCSSRFSNLLSSGCAIRKIPWSYFRSILTWKANVRAIAHDLLRSPSGGKGELNGITNAIQRLNRSTIAGVSCDAFS